MDSESCTSWRARTSLPDAKYRVVYADPPWKYNDKADVGSVQSGGPCINTQPDDREALRARFTGG